MTMGQIIDEIRDMSDMEYSLMRIQGGLSDELVHMIIEMMPDARDIVKPKEEQYQSLVKTDKS